MKILVTGATGLIGRKLVHQLLQQGYQVYALARNPQKLPELPPSQVFRWSGFEPPPTEAIRNCTAIIHLAGEGIADRLWTESRKKSLRDSRILSTQNIVQAISQLPKNERPPTLVAASAIGYYSQSNLPQDESSLSGHDFLSRLCIDWEDAALEAEKSEVRTVLLRTGLVLARNGGLLEKSAPVILGDGKQWMSWIHVEDVIGLINLALREPQLRGPLNATAPHPVTNKVFTQTLALIKRVPFTFRVPAVLLRLILGDLSQAVLANQNVLPQKAQQAGYNFKFKELEKALRDLLVGGERLDNHFSTKQYVPVSREQVFSFFSKAENLEVLTPPWLNFQILKKSTPEIQKGTLIDYRLKIHGVPARWRTLIKEWNPDTSFVDFQLRGPYKKWHHLHTFEEVFGGTLISDDVTFVIPGGYLGKLLLPFIRKDVEKIFSYRQQMIEKLQTEGLIK